MGDEGGVWVSLHSPSSHAKGCGKTTFLDILTGRRKTGTTKVHPFGL